MNTFEAECHQLTNQLKEMQKAYEMLHNEKLALEHSLKETRPTATSPSREAHRDERACPPAADESSRPVRPTPTGPSWVNSIYVFCGSTNSSFLGKLPMQFSGGIVWKLGRMAREGYL